MYVEICSNDELPEVELISLLEETIPQYKLRADTLTQFTGKIKWIKLLTMFIDKLYIMKI